MNVRGGGLMVGIALAALLCACEAQVVPYTNPGEMGVDSAVGPILLRAVHVEAPPGGGYPPGGEATVRLTLINEGDEPDALVSVASPAADRVEIRWDRDCDGWAEAVGVLPMLPANPGPREEASLARPFDPYHLRLVDLRQEVLAGTVVPLVLTFAEAGDHRTAAYVLPPDARLVEPRRRCDRDTTPGQRTAAPSGASMMK
jgi:copper(I)-binding protein